MKTALLGWHVLLHSLLSTNHLGEGECMYALSGEQTKAPWRWVVLAGVNWGQGKDSSLLVFGQQTSWMPAEELDTAGEDWQTDTLGSSIKIYLYLPLSLGCQLGTGTRLGLSVYQLPMQDNIANKNSKPGRKGHG